MKIVEKELLALLIEREKKILFLVCLANKSECSFLFPRLVVISAETKVTLVRNAFKVNITNLATVKRVTSRTCVYIMRNKKKKKKKKKKTTEQAVVIFTEVKDMVESPLQ